MHATELERKELGRTTVVAECLEKLTTSPAAKRSADVVKALSQRFAIRTPPASGPMMVDGYRVLSRPQYAKLCEALDLIESMDRMLIELQRCIAQVPPEGLEIVPAVFVSQARGGLGFVHGELLRANDRHHYAMERMAPSMPVRGAGVRK